MVPSLLAGLAFALAVVSPVADKAAKKAAIPQIGHMVYFKLKDSTPANREKLVDACKKFLVEHEGIVYFAAGVIGDDFKREVNDRDWDVALHLVFETKAAHDNYATAPDHLKFIDENKATWDKVRVFDSEIVPLAKKKKVADK